MDEKLLDFFKDDVPGYILGADEHSMRVHIAGLFGEEDASFTIADVAMYQAAYGGGSMETIRVLGTVMGDHSMMDNLYDMVLNWFAFVNPGELVEAGLTL